MVFVHQLPFRVHVSFTRLGDVVVDRLKALQPHTSVPFALAMDQPLGPFRSTALMDAAAANNAVLVTLLLDSGVDASLRNTRGRTAFDIARALGRPHLLALLGRGSSDEVVPYSTVKVMVLGDTLAGKSSLVQALAHACKRGVAAFRPDMTRFAAPLRGTAMECRTVGIDVSTVTVQPLDLVGSGGAGTTLNALMFDTAGHNELFNAHTPFISSTGVYWIVFSLEWDEDRIRRYVTLWAAVLRHDSDERCVVGVIGTHRCGVELSDEEGRRLDGALTAVRGELTDSRLCADVMVAAVDSLTGFGIASLVSKLWAWWYGHAGYFTAPQRWVRAMDCVMAAKAVTVATDEGSQPWLSPVMSVNDVQCLLEPVGITDRSELRLALAFLDAVGVIVYRGRVDDDHSDHSAVDYIILPRPEVVIDGLQRIVTSTVAALMEARRALTTGSAWCHSCGTLPSKGILGAFATCLSSCELCKRWYCSSHIHRVSVGGTITVACGTCLPLVAMRSSAGVDGDVGQCCDVSELSSSGRLSRSLLKSLWSGYSPVLCVALEVLLRKLNFMCRAPEVPRCPTGSPSRTASALSDGGSANNGVDSDDENDLFVPCVFVQCSFIRGAGGAWQERGCARQWWIDGSHWPVNIWCDIIGCLSTLPVRWQPIRNPTAADTSTTSGSVASRSAISTADGSISTQEAVWLDRFPGCGTVIHLQSRKQFPPDVGMEEVKVHLECSKSPDGVTRNRVVVSGWYTLRSGKREWHTLAGRQWQLLSDALQCVHEQLSDDKVLKGCHDVTAIRTACAHCSGTTVTGSCSESWSTVAHPAAGKYWRG